MIGTIKKHSVRFNFYIFRVTLQCFVIIANVSHITYDLRKSRGQRPTDTHNPPNIRERASWRSINVHFGRLNKSYYRVSPNEAPRSILVFVPRSVGVVVVCRSCQLPEAVSFYLLYPPPPALSPLPSSDSFSSFFARDAVFISGDDRRKRRRKRGRGPRIS